MKRGFLLPVVMILLVLLVSTMGYQTSWAQTGQATSTCAVPGGYATIQAAVDDPACDLVNVGSGTFSENVVIERSVTIRGQGAAATIVDGGGGDHVFDILASTEGDQSVTMTVTISDLSIINGDSGLFAESRNVSWGGGFAYLTVNVSDCTIRSNDGNGVLAYPHDFGQTEFRIQDCTISENLGPGISNFPGSFGSAYLDVINSTISDNSEGGIVNVGCSHGLCTAELNVTGSTISGNSGTGIYNADLANITNSTISGNTAGAGGGLSSCRTANLYNSTISGNTAGSGGGIIIIGDTMPYGCRGAVTASHTIIANSGNGGDCHLTLTEGPWAATFTDGGHNIVEDGACIDAPTSHSGDPKLGPLADNYGATLTHALLPGSSAIDAGDNAAGPDTDQRGRPRPVDGD